MVCTSVVYALGLVMLLAAPSLSPLFGKSSKGSSSKGGDSSKPVLALQDGSTTNLVIQKSTQTLRFPAHGHLTCYYNKARTAKDHPQIHGVKIFAPKGVTLTKLEGGFTNLFLTFTAKGSGSATINSEMWGYETCKAPAKIDWTYDCH